MNITAELMTEHRPETPQWIAGRLVVSSNKPTVSVKRNAPVEAIMAGLTENEKAEALTLARKGKRRIAAYTITSTPVAPAGELVWSDEGDCLGFRIFD